MMIILKFTLDKSGTDGLGPGASPLEKWVLFMQNLRKLNICSYF